MIYLLFWEKALSCDLSHLLDIIDPYVWTIRWNQNQSVLYSRFSVELLRAALCRWSHCHSFLDFQHDGFVFPCQSYLLVHSFLFYCIVFVYQMSLCMWKIALPVDISCEFLFNCQTLVIRSQTEYLVSWVTQIILDTHLKWVRLFAVSVGQRTAIEDSSEPGNQCWLIRKVWMYNSEHVESP